MTCTAMTCDKPTRDDAYVCDDCLDHFARRLGDITWLDEELDITIAKMHASGATGSPSAETALPINTEASKRREALRHELAMLVRFCDEEGVRASDPSDTLPANTIVAMSRWLLWRVDGLAFNDMSAEFVTSVSSAVKRCRQIIDLPPERSYAGPCPECKRDLYHRPNAAEVKCSGCGTTWTVAEVNAWMQERINDHLTNRLVTAHEGATLLSRFGLEVAPNVINKWNERGKLDQVGTVAREAGGKPRPLFRWEDLLPLATRHAAQQASA